jgi:DNA-binding transcriptional LysR family regulator
MLGDRTSLLDPRQLEAIVVVAETHSVHAAARRLGVPQPQLSRLVAAAENTLGLKLFERSRSGMQAAASSSERVIKEAAFALEALRDVSKSAREGVSTIRLGCLPRVMHVLIPHLLAEMADRDVGFQLQVSVGTSNEVAAELQAGHIDVVIGRRVAPVRENGIDLDADRLYAERTVVVCGYDNRLIGGRTAHISQLARHNWLLPKRGFYSRDILDSMVSRAGLPPIVPIIESNSFDSSLSVVAVTRFLTIAPEFFARRLERLRLVRIVQMKPSLGTGSLMLQYQHRQRAHPGFDAFRAVVMRAAKKVRASE